MRATSLAGSRSPTHCRISCNCPLLAHVVFWKCAIFEVWAGRHFCRGKSEPSFVLASGSYCLKWQKVAISPPHLGELGIRSVIFRCLSRKLSPPVLLCYMGQELRPKETLMSSNVAAPFLGRECHSLSDSSLSRLGVRDTAGGLTSRSIWVNLELAIRLYSSR